MHQLGFMQVALQQSVATLVVEMSRIIGGLMLVLVLGVYSRWVAALAVVQLFLASTVHFGNGWSSTNANGGWDYPIYLTITALVVALLGDGPFALKSTTKS